MADLNPLTLKFTQVETETEYCLQEQTHLTRLAMPLIGVLAGLSVARIIVSSSDETEVSWGSVILGLCLVLSCAMVRASLKVYVVAATMVLLYLTAVEWAVSYNDFFCYQVRGLWVLLAVVSVYAGTMIFTANWPIFAGITVAGGLYAILRTYYHFYQSDLFALLVLATVPALIGYWKTKFSRLMFVQLAGLKEDCNSWKRLYDSSPEALIVLTDLAVIHFNTAAAHLLGNYDPNRVWEKIERMTSFDGTKLVSLMPKLQTEASANLNMLGLFEYPRDDGRLLNLEAKIRAIQFQQQPALLLSLADFSEHKATIEAELNSTFNRLLERCFKNELRPQLNELAANLYFLKGYLPRNLEPYYSDTHMSLLLVYYSLYDIQDLLDSRHKRQFAPQYSKVGLYDETSKCVEVMTVLSARRNITIQLHFDSNLPSKVHLDRIRYRQLLVGSMKQALSTCKYGSKVHVSLSLHSTSSQMREIEVLVTPIKSDDSLLVQSMSLIAKELGSTGLIWAESDLSFSLYAPAAMRRVEDVKVDVADVSIDDSPSPDLKA